MIVTLCGKCEDIQVSIKITRATTTVPPRKVPRPKKIPRKKFVL